MKIAETDDENLKRRDERRNYCEIEEACTNYLNLLLRQGNKKNLNYVYLYILPVIFITGLTLMHFDLMVPGSVLMILPAVCAFYSFLMNARSKGQYIKEISNIENRFYELTGEKLTGGIAQLQTKRDELRSKTNFN